MLYLHGLGHFHPENEFDNAFLESLDIGTTDQWILDRVGIRSRRTVLPLDYIRATKNKDLRGAAEAALYSNAETGRRAGLMAIERAGIQPSDIGMVICGGCSPDHCIPAEASRIARALGIAVPSFDVHAACSTFGAHLHLLDGMGASAPDYVLVVHPENATRVIDFSDRSTAVLFGDATSARVHRPPGQPHHARERLPAGRHPARAALPQHRPVRQPVRRGCPHGALAELGPLRSRRSCRSDRGGLRPVLVQPRNRLRLRAPDGAAPWRAARVDL
jgi:3-oxoacyl-[acyl-carrier-protein] synthase III